MEQCDYLHLIIIRGKNSSNSSTAFPKGGWQHLSSLGPAAAAGWDSYSGKLWVPLPEKLRAHHQHWGLESALGVPSLCWPHRGLGEVSPSLLSSAAKVTQVVTAGGELSPALLSHRAPGFKPVRQSLRSFTNSSQKFVSRKNTGTQHGR